ncbi:hypothetical protein CA13_32730 [Planctomycetes bacterium CA13]|uniref:Uncharacterized protein n=1 Tax=Novipirellula herctigrandis TaxID=2527986 RepID=A0A5C5Z3P5_9BACT|nr:hypothetical protein CA13_32730 [Planctomycetes bacterium CA13]
MTQLLLHPDDISQLKRWLWINVKCVVVVVVLFLLSGVRGSGSSADEQLRGQVSLESTLALPVETELRLLNAHQPRPIPPTGWRRTNHGWEHTSTWPSDIVAGEKKSISELIAIQEAREPMWLQVTLGKVRGVPPLMIALIQITAIAVLISIGRHKRVES